MRRKFDKILIVKVARDDKAELDKVARRLDLTVTEVVRRSIRLGVTLLRQIDFPGASERSQLQ